MEHTTPLDVPGSKPWRLVPFFPRKHRAVLTDFFHAIEADPVLEQAMQTPLGHRTLSPCGARSTSRLPRPQAFLLFFVEVKALVEAERVPESSVTYINARCVAEEQLGSVVNVGEFLNQCACVRA